MKTNKKFDTIELRFAKKPSKSILDKLRKSNFTWSPKFKHWYAKKTEQTEAFAESLGAKSKGRQTKMRF